MVQFAVATSIALVQLAMLAQTSYGLPVEPGTKFEARAIMDNTDSQLFKREQMELETRQPLGTLAKVAIGATGIGLGYLAYQHIKKVRERKAQQAAAAASNPPGGGGGGGGGGDQGGYGTGNGNSKREWNDFQERYWDDGLEERGWDDVLEERGLFMDELD